jgi:hypothetical protein
MVSDVYEQVTAIGAASHHACRFCDRCGGRESENENEGVRRHCCTAVFAVVGFLTPLKTYCGVCVLVGA